MWFKYKKSQCFIWIRNKESIWFTVVLIQEKGTKRIFDISTINTIEYRSGEICDEVIEGRDTIKKVIESMYNKYWWDKIDS